MIPRNIIIVALMGCLAAPGNAQSATAPEEATVELSPFVVSSASNNGYLAANAVGATRTSERVMDIPMNIQVMDRQFLSDLSFDDSMGAARYFTDGGWGQRTDGPREFAFRGFATQAVTVNFHPSISQGDAVGIERIEQVLGPNSLLYGATDPGGLFNVVTKRPVLGTDFAEASAKVGSFGYNRFTGTLNGGTKDFAVQADAASTGNASWHTYASNQNRYLYAAALWQITPSTTLWLNTDVWSRRSDPYKSSIPTLNGLPPSAAVLPPADAQSYVAGPYGINDYKDKSYTATVEQRITDRWHVEASVNEQYEDRWTNNPAQEGTITASPTLGFTMPVNPQIRRDFERQKSCLLFSTYSLDLGWMKQQVLLNVAHSEFDRLLLAQFYTKNGGTAADNYTIQILPGDPAAQFVVPVGGYFAYNNATANQNIGQYSTNGFLALSGSYWEGRVHTLFGLRDDKLETVTHAPTVSSDLGSVAFGPAMPQRPSTSPQPSAGILVELTGNVSAYANYTRSFQNSTVFNLDVNGNPLPPVYGKGEEAGLKASFLNDKLSFTADVFRIDEENVAETVPATVLAQLGIAGPASEPGISGRSVGTEFHVVGSPAPGLTFLGSYFVDDAYETGDLYTPSAVGQKLRSLVPKGANAFARYELQTGCLKGLFFGAGFTDRNSPPLSYNSSRQPIYITNGTEHPVDLLAGYSRRFVRHLKWTVQFNASNALNERTMGVFNSADLYLDPAQYYVTNTLAF